MWGTIVDDSRIQPLLQEALWQSFFNKVLDAIAEIVDTLIKTEGYCPVDTGWLRANHNTRLEDDMVKYITNIVFYWVFVVFGHRIRGSDKYVPPNDYLYRAITTAFSGGYVEDIVREKLSEVIK